MKYNKASEIIKALENTDSRLEKEKIIEDAYSSGCFDFFGGARLAYDALVTFGIKQLPNYPKNQVDPENDYNEVIAKFFDLTEALRHRNITGNAAKDAVKSLINTADREDYDLFFKRILGKNLKAGVSNKTINKVLKKLSKNDEKAKEFLIPVFECQLASDSYDHPKKMAGEKICDFKYDGVRIITIIDFQKNSVEQYTRNGRLNENFQNIKTEFESNIKRLRTLYPKGVVIDGEVVSEDFQMLMTQVNRKENINTNDANYFVFDVISLPSFKMAKCEKSQAERCKELNIIFDSCEFNNVIQTSQHFINLDTEEGKREYNELVDLAIQSGLEGVMIKEASAPYECKRGTNWLKQKPTITVDLVVKETLIGTGRNCTRLGALVCEGEHGDILLSTNVGSGFTDEQRDEFWQSRGELIDKIVEVKSDGISQNKDGTYSLRFPRFTRFRGDIEEGKI